jgi:hypothetical protein
MSRAGPLNRASSLCRAKLLVFHMRRASPASAIEIPAYWPISAQEKVPRTENFPKISIGSERIVGLTHFIPNPFRSAF